MTVRSRFVTIWAVTRTLSGRNDDAAENPDESADPAFRKCLRSIWLDTTFDTHMIVFLRPRLSESMPEKREASQEPPAMLAVIPP